MTCSEDGTVRIWDATAITQKTVIKPTLAKQQRTSVTACSYSSDGTLLGAGLIDGSIQIWNVAGELPNGVAPSDFDQTACFHTKIQYSYCCSECTG